MSHLNALRALEAVARTGSFAAAGAELGVTPGAVSQKVRQLEDYLGRALIARSGRTVVMTALARDVFEELRAGFSSLDVAWKRLQARSRDDGISVTLPPSVATKWLLPRLERFHARFGRARIDLVTTDVLLDLEREGVDFAIRYGPSSHADAGGILLADELLVPVCAPDLAAGLRTAEDLSRHRLIHDRTLAAFSDFPQWSDWLAAAGIYDRNASSDISVDASALAIQAAVGGLGVALMRSLLAQDELAAGTLVAPFDNVLPSPFSYYLLRRGRQRRRGPARIFEDWLTEEFAASSAGFAKPRIGRNDPK